MTLPWRPGMTCEGYTLVQPLGSGSFGEVWLAEDASKHRLALKFSPQRRDRKAYTDLFKQEFALLSELRHAHLARVFDFGVSPRGDYFFTEELCPGQNFLKAIGGKPTSYLEVCLVQLLSALDYIHAMGIAHFDIKADNILVEDIDGKPNVKVLDFGIAAKLKNLPAFAGGTLIYMAPELIQRSKIFDHRADLYSLGMLCLRALTNRLPFPKDNAKAIMKWHVEEPLPESIWEGLSVSKHLRELTEKLLRKRPDDRFSTARVAINFLNQTTGHKYRKEEEALQPHLPNEGPLVGRDDLLETLKKRIEDSQVTVLSGEAGIGKSRLLLEIRRWLEWKEIPFVQMVEGFQTPFWDRFANEPDETLRAKRRAVFVLEEARRLPFGLLIDDAHSADRDTTLFLSELSSRLAQPKGSGRGPLFFALMMTEDTADSSLAIPRLSPEDVAQYGERVLGKRDGLDRLSQWLFAYSGGLPLLMVEGFRFLAPRFLKGEPLENLTLPPGLESLYEKKIENLSEDEKEVLFLLALLGRPAGADELARILGRPIEDLPKLLTTVQRLGLVSSAYESPVHRLSSQALGLDLVRRLDAERKPHLHRRIAIGLESSAEASAEELGTHWAQAGDPDKGRPFFQKAASSFKEAGQLSRAARCFAQAAVLATRGSEDWAELKRETIRLLVSTGNFLEAESSLKDLEEGSPSAAGLAEIRGLLAFKKRDFAAARKNYEEALQQVPENDPVSKIDIENALANVDLQSGLWDQASRRFKDTLESESTLPPEAREKISGNNLGLALCRLGRFEEAVRFYENRLAQRETDPREQVALRNALGYVFIQASRFAEAIDCLERARQLTENHGGLHVLFSVMGNLVTAYFKEARYVESLQILKELFSLQQHLGSERDVAYNLLRQGSTYLVLGMEEGAHDCFERGLSLVGSSDPVLACWFRLMEAYREKEFGDREKAMAAFAGLLKEKDLADRSHLAWASLALAEILHEEGENEEARERLGAIPESFQDDEFALRRDLLLAKMSGEPPEKLFPPLEERGLRNHFLEVLWEIYHAWGRSLLASGNRTLAKTQLEKGVVLLKRIADSLPEEYRDRYLRFKERALLLSQYETFET